MIIGRLGVVVLVIALLSFGVGAAFADWRKADVGAAIQLADVDARKDDGGADDVILVADDDDRGDGDKTRGNDGTRGGNNTGDGDRTRGNDGTRGGNNTGDGDRTRGNDGTRGGDNTRAAAPAGGGDTGGNTGGGTGGGDT